MLNFYVELHTGKYFRNLGKPNQNQNLFIILLLIWKQKEARLTRFRKDFYYKDSKIDLCVYIDCMLRLGFINDT